jgi:hypothetical protein
MNNDSKVSTHGSPRQSNYQGQYVVTGHTVKERQRRYIGHDASPIGNCTVAEPRHVKRGKNRTMKGLTMYP